MAAHASQRKLDLMTAAVMLAARGGQAAATIRAIAEKVGVTEGAVYRHFRSKEELCWSAYKRIVAEMVEQKRHLATQGIPIRQRIDEWVRLTFEFFDRQPEAFAYVLLTEHKVPEGECEITHVQGKLFKAMVHDSMATGELRQLDPDVALSHLTGLMLNIPRLIRAGDLQGPASNYTKEIANAVWRVLAP